MHQLLQNIPHITETISFL